MAEKFRYDLLYNRDIPRFHECFPDKSARIDGKTYSYKLAGEGEPVIILLSGGFGVCASWFRHMQHFIKNFRVLAFDYPVELDNNAALADWIAKLTSLLQLPPAVLVGQSYGGCLAQVIARRHPGIVRGMVLSNTAALTPGTRHELQGMANKLMLLYRLVKVLPYSWLKPLFLKMSLSKVKDGTKEEQAYMKAVFKDLMAPYTKQKELQMDRLLLGLTEEASCTPEHFVILGGKVMLILSPDDKTFSEDVKQQLIYLMPNPAVCTSLSGGHLATVLHIEEYIREVSSFIKTL